MQRFLCEEKFQRVFLLFLLKSTTLSYTWLLCLLKSSFVIFREEVLKTLLLMSSFFVLVQRRGLADFCPPICSATAEIDLQSPEPFLYHFKRLIGSVPIGEGPEDVAQWRG